MIAAVVASLLTGIPMAPPPGVVVLHTRTSPEITQREKRLYDALTLALDGFAVMLTPPSKDDFAGLTLPEQVAIALPEMDGVASGAVAVVWLVRPAPRQLMVHLVARNTGRTLVKTVETTSGPDAEATLALVVKELLGAAFLFEPPAALPPGLGSVVQSVRAQVASPVTASPPAPPPPPSPVRLRHQLSLFGGTRFVAQSGNGLRAGLGGRLGFVALERLALSVALELSTGPLEPGFVAIDGALGLDAFVPLGETRSFGPFLLISGGPRWQRATFDAITTEGVTVATLVLGGLRTFLSVRERLWLVVDLGLGVHPLPTRLIQGSSTLWREGWLEGRASLGLAWEGP